jgi:hypothetical protein
MNRHPGIMGLQRRRDFLRSTAGAAALGGLGGLTGGLGLPRLGHAQEGPWAVRPESEVDRLNFVVWTYGDIYSQISQKFEEDWGVPVDSTISSFNDHPTKLITMFAGGETIDVSQSSPFSFPNFIDQGLVSRSTICRGSRITSAISRRSRSRSRSMTGRPWGCPISLRSGSGTITRTCWTRPASINRSRTTTS